MSLTELSITERIETVSKFLGDYAFIAHQTVYSPFWDNIIFPETKVLQITRNTIKRENEFDFKEEDFHWKHKYEEGISMRNIWDAIQVLAKYRDRAHFHSVDGMLFQGALVLNVELK